MPTVKSEGGSASELDGATPETSGSSGPSVKITRTVGTMTNSVRSRASTRVKTERTSAIENEKDLVDRRREQWRLKKREQRAKMAARLTKSREKVTPVITASAHFLFPYANQGGQTQTLRKSARLAKESARKPPNLVPPSSIPRSRTPRHRSLEAQKHGKVKSLSMALPSKMRLIPQMYAGDTPEQIIAKQREYWRIKKREQRAKLSMEAKARLKEKETLMRRVRRYQNILREMRRARASEPGLKAIGGYIEEDGAVSASVSQTQSLNGIARKDGIRVSEAKVLLRSPTRSLKTTPVHSFSHLTLTCPRSQRKPSFPDASSRVGRAGCVMRVLVSDKGLTNEDRMAKKREYWRVSKRQQRAARAARLRQSLAEARLAPKLQRNKGPKPAYRAPLLNTSKPTNAIKQEPDLNPGPEQELCPDRRPLLVPKPEPDLAPASDCQATTLLAVASMKKLLEESLSTVNDDKDQEPDVGTKVKGEPGEWEVEEEPDRTKVKEEPGGTEVKEEPTRTEVTPVVQAQDRDAGRRHCPSVAISLQQKREYWKLMKRQQRARQKERQGKGGRGRGRGRGRGSLPLRSNQAPALAARSINKTPANLLPKTTSSSGNSVPAVRPKLPKTLADKPPNCADMDPALRTLTPPDNPLPNIILHRIEPPAQTVRPAPFKRFCPLPLNTTGAPKRHPDESEEDFLKRKREYWRIKKKEQRARKSVSEKMIPQRRACVPPAQNLQDFCQRAMFDRMSDESEHLISNSVDSNSDYTAPLQDELLLADAERPPGDPVSWRNSYLMDYDPLNQLLVCMACGELQHSQNLEAVLAHIDEAHPHTRSLAHAERRRILEAWDEQVSRRERFFTRQLQQRGATLAETYMN